MRSQDASCVAACQLVQDAIARQEPFLKKTLNLRHKLFAHTDFHAPLFAVFGFKDLEIIHFRAYWNEILTAMEACDLAMFGATEHSPKFERSLFSSIEVATNKVLSENQTVAPRET